MPLWDAGGPAHDGSMTDEAADRARPGRAAQSDVIPVGVCVVATRVAVPVLEDLPDPAGKAVLVRATFDRPLADDPALPLAFARARGLAATIDWLTTRGARVTVCGNPTGNGAAEEAHHLDRVRQSIGSLLAAASAPGAVTFRPCPEVAASVDRLIEDHHLFVNDTLQDSALPLPSLTRPPRRLPSAAGRTLEHDVQVLSPLLATPARPFVAVLGGTRSSDRLHGLQGLVLRADTVLLGGALALPLLQAIGKQPVDSTSDEFLWECRTVVGLSRRLHHQVVMPLDLVWEREDGSVVTTPADVRGDGHVVDVGPVTRVRFAEVVHGAGVTLWAGALGRVEDPAFAEGTRAVAASLPAAGSPVVLGGDALVSALGASSLVPSSAKFLSATDASIELLKAGDLPGLAALRH